MTELSLCSSDEGRDSVKKRYENIFHRKFFKVTWMCWSQFCGADETAIEKTWIFDADANVGFYEIYANNKVSEIRIDKVSETRFNRLTNLLNNGFENEEIVCGGCDGEGWEMILFDERGKIKDKFYGYIDDNKSLNRIVRLVKDVID